MPRVNPITLPTPGDGDSASGYSTRMMFSHFGDQVPQGALGGGGGGSGVLKRNFWFQRFVPVSFSDAEAGGLCDRTGLYYPGGRMRTTSDGERHGEDYFRDDPNTDDWSEDTWQP